jgi:ferritin-like metal-binding protein YciE
MNDRIRTRITQAVGRCTRSSTDYAAVVLVGTELLDFTIKRENKIHFHPELRAEMEFGFDNSEVDDINSLTTLLDIFLNKDDSWLNAEADITKRRDESLIRETKSHIEILQDVVRLEIDCLYDLWRDDFNSALIKATSIIDKLSGDALAGYRALWNYFAGCICYQLSEINKDDKLVRTASDRFNRASKLAISIPWFSRLSNELSSETTSVAQETDLLLYSSENLNDYFQKLGTVGTKFERRMSDIYEGLHDTDPNKFDPSLSDLGKMLGFESSRPDGTGTPDCFWRIFTNYVLLFECKSSEESDNAISIRTCRQAQGHNKWCSTQQFFTQNAKIITIIVSPRRILDKNAIPHASELYYCHLDDIRALYNQALSMLRGVRSRITDLESNERIEVLRAELKKHNLFSYNIIDMLTSKKLIDIDSE